MCERVCVGESGVSGEKVEEVEARSSFSQWEGVRKE